MDYPMGPMPEISYTLNYLLIITISVSILVLLFSEQIDKLIAIFPKRDQLFTNIYVCMWVIMILLYAILIGYCIFNTFQ